MQGAHTGSFRQEIRQEMKTVYLDNNATTRVDEHVVEAMLPYLRENYGNPSSIYDLGGVAQKAVKVAREQIKEFVGAKNANEIIFTSSGSEGANLAIKGVLDNVPNKKHIITTRVEHACVLNLYQTLEKQGYEATYLGVDSKGQLDLEELKNAIRPDTALVSIMWANNETGIIFPVEEIAKVVKAKNPDTKVFVDAVQAAGKIKMNVSENSIDLLVISGHKFYAPKGIGALYVKKGVRIIPQIVGGHQESSKRAGTENVPYIVGIGKAAELAMRDFDKNVAEIKRLRDKLEKGILERVFNARLNSDTTNRVVNTTNIGFEYVEGELILLYLNDEGIFASSGSACTSGDLDPSHVLKAMGVPFTSLHGSIRFSLSHYTTEAEIDYVLEKLPSVIEKIASISPFQKELEELRKKALI